MTRWLQYNMRVFKEELVYGHTANQQSQVEIAWPRGNADDGLLYTNSQAAVISQQVKLDE